MLRPERTEKARSAALLFSVLCLVLAGCKDGRDWPEVAIVAAGVECHMTAEQLQRLCQDNRARHYGVPTKTAGTPQFYCYAGDTGISFWIGRHGLERYQVWDTIGQPDGSTGRTDPQVSVCPAIPEQPSVASTNSLPPAEPALEQVTGDSTPDEPMPVGGEVTAPVVVKRVEPAWPEQVTRQRSWVFSLVVTKRGRVKDLQLVRGEPDLYSELAEEAILKWELKPGTYRGKPVDVHYNLSVTTHVR
jgi:hypothetical protein